MIKINKEEIKQITGQRIKSLREQKNISQQRLANKINVSRVTIHYYEKGIMFPSVENLIGLSKALNTSTDYLLGNSESPTSIKDLQNKIEKIERVIEK